MTPNSDQPAESNDSESGSIETRQQMIDAISTRAYFLWENAGRPEGRDDDFWFQAEQDINGPKGD